MHSKNKKIIMKSYYRCKDRLINFMKFIIIKQRNSQNITNRKQFNLTIVKKNILKKLNKSQQKPWNLMES